jgi:hypothetical protein
MRCYQIETLEDTQQYSKEEIEAIIGDELVCLHQENKRLRTPSPNAGTNDQTKGGNEKSSNHAATNCARKSNPI